MGYLLKDKLRALRKNRNLTQSDVGAYLNMTRQGYAHYEKGHRTPDYQTLIKLASLYQLDINELINTDTIPMELISLHDGENYNINKTNKNDEIHISIRLNDDERKLISIFRMLTDSEKKALLLSLNNKIQKKKK